MRARVTQVRPPAWAQDSMVAVFVTVMQVQGTVVRNDGQPESVLRPLSDLGNLGYLLLIVSGAVVALRRVWPVPVFVVTAVASAVYYALGFPDGPGWLGLFVAIYTVTSRGDGHRSLLTVSAGITVLTVIWLIAAADIEPPAAVGWVFFRIGASVMSAALGESVRSRKIIAAEALERAEQAERSREERARALVDEERLRIAREVHDTVAHAVAIINVQSGVAAHVLDKRPERTRHTLEVIEQTSSRALQEMRTILGVLHDDGGARTPPAGLGQLDELTEQAREAGLEVDLETTVPPPHIPDAVGRAVYRILQESITNVIRHVGRSRVAIAVTYGVDTVDVRVTDDGGRVDDGRVASEILGAGGRAAPDGAVVSDDGGRGIAGMRERCRLLGGDLRAGPVAGGGFAVDARIPVMPGRTAAL